MSLITIHKHGQVLLAHIAPLNPPQPFCHGTETPAAISTPCTAQTMEFDEQGYANVTVAFQPEKDSLAVEMRRKLQDDDAQSFPCHRSELQVLAMKDKNSPLHDVTQWSVHFARKILTYTPVLKTFVYVTYYPMLVETIMGKLEELYKALRRLHMSGDHGVLENWVMPRILLRSKKAFEAGLRTGEFFCAGASRSLRFLREWEKLNVRFPV